MNLAGTLFISLVSIKYIWYSTVIVVKLRLQFGGTVPGKLGGSDEPLSKQPSLHFGT